MRGSHLRMLIYDMKFLGSEEYDGDNNIKYKPAKIIIDTNEAAKSMGKCNKDTAESQHDVSVT